MSRPEIRSRCPFGYSPLMRAVVQCGARARPGGLAPRAVSRRRRMRNRSRLVRRSLADREPQNGGTCRVVGRGVKLHEMRPRFGCREGRLQKAQRFGVGATDDERQLQLVHPIGHAIVGGPVTLELSVGAQLVHQCFDEFRFARKLPAQGRTGAPCRTVPVGPDDPTRRVVEDAPNAVAFPRRTRRRVIEYRPEEAIPRERVTASIPHDRRRRLEIVENGDDSG
jgi:hypothetical protein